MYCIYLNRSPDIYCLYFLALTFKSVHHLFRPWRLTHASAGVYKFSSVVIGQHIYVLVKAWRRVLYVIIKHKASGRDANKARGKAKCFIGHRGSALMRARARPCFNCFKEFTLKKLTPFNIHAVIHFSMPSKMISDDFLCKHFSEKAYFG